MRPLPLLAVSLLAASSVRASSLAELKVLAGSAELADIPSVDGRPVGGPAESAGLESAPLRVHGAPSLAALAAETVRRGECSTPSDDPDFAHDSSTYCTTVIDPARGFWGGYRAYVTVRDGASIHYHAQTPVLTIGIGALSGEEFRAVETITIDADADGRVRSVVKTVPLVSKDGVCPNASRSDSFLVRGHDRDRTVTVCTHRLPYEREEHGPLVQEAQERWAAALRR